MEPDTDPAVAPLRAVTRRLDDAGALAPTPLATLDRRARRLRARRRVAPALAAVAVLAAGGVALARTPEGDGPEQVVAGGSASAGTAPSGRWDRTDLIVFMHPTATADQIDAMRAELEASGAVRRVGFVDQQQAFEEFVVMFRDSPDMVASVEPEVLPSSFRVDVGGDGHVLDELQARLRQDAGVIEVVRTPPGSLPPPVPPGFH